MRKLNLSTPTAINNAINAGAIHPDAADAALAALAARDRLQHIVQACETALRRIDGGEYGTAG